MIPKGSVPTPTPMKRHRFHLLDGMRGIAALIVVPHHISTYTYANTHLGQYPAVDFFFCLSGFVVAFSYEKRITDGTITLYDFSVVRAIRLYPMAVLGTLLGAFVLIISPGRLAWSAPPTLLRTVLGLLLIPCPNRPGHLLFPLDPVLWSLFLELGANFAFALALRWRLARSGVVALAALLSFASMARTIRIGGDLTGGADIFGLPMAIKRVTLSFCMGVLVMRFYKLSSHFRFKGGSAFAAILVVIFITAMTLYLSFAFKYGLLVAIGLLSPAAIFVAAHVVLEGVWAKICSFMGEISYPLYVIHLPLIFTLFLVSPTREFLVTNPSLTNVTLVSYLFFLILLSSLVEKFYDRPVRKIMLAFRKRERSQSLA